MTNISLITTPSYSYFKDSENRLVIFPTKEMFIDIMRTHLEKQKEQDLKELTNPIIQALELLNGDKTKLVKYMWDGILSKEDCNKETLEKLNNIENSNTNLKDLILEIYVYIAKTGLHDLGIDIKRYIPNVYVTDKRNIFNKVIYDEIQGMLISDQEIYIETKQKEEKYCYFNSDILYFNLQIQRFNYVLTQQEIWQAEYELEQSASITECPTYLKALTLVIEEIINLKV